MTLVQAVASIPPWVVLVAFLAVIVLISLRTRSYTDVRVGNATVHAELADNLIKQMLGLMGRGALSESEGMLFPLWQESRPSFWMMGMRIPIDVVYFDSNGTVVDVKRDVQPFSFSNPSTNFSPSQNAMYVLEVSAGFVQRHEIKVGAKAKFTI
ncbi:MAG: DUF192 domain-containing protein [Candidatus Aenigmarchaeota archaeon]|nr:DUF192 domain-containing protein [Candidatus Aenigmarchaeota archaeon]